MDRVKIAKELVKIAEELEEVDLSSHTAGVKDVLNKIFRRVRDNRLVNEMTEKVMQFFKTKNPADDLTRPEVSSIYRQENYGKSFDMPKGKKLDIGWTDHAEYRSDLRDIDPLKVNESIKNFAETHPNKRQKVNLTNRGIGKAVVDINTMSNPSFAQVITVMSSDNSPSYDVNNDGEAVKVGNTTTLDELASAGGVQFIPKFHSGRSFIVTNSGVFVRGPYGAETFREVRTRDLNLECAYDDSDGSRNPFLYFGNNYRTLKEMLAGSGKYNMKRMAVRG